ncbi:MAG: C40 family peptidase [Oscillospiraceae bacterium]|nr:C40 family peptidase [Oscillospiraceae bacterium]
MKKTIKVNQAKKTLILLPAAILTMALLLLSSGCRGEKINITDSNTPPPPTSPVTSPQSDSPTGEDVPLPQTPEPDTQEIPAEPNPAYQTEPITDITTEPPTDGETSVMPAEENQIANTAKSLLGIPFTDGGSSPSEGFDNSGFIYYVLRQNGYVNSPRGLQEQSVMGNKVDSISELRSGDLVFFAENSDKPQFGGIYIGDGVMISCRMPGEDVREFDISSGYYKENFLTGVRVL